VNVLLIALPNNSMKWTPLNLLSLAGTLEDNGIDCKVVDSNIENVYPEIRKNYDIIGLSVLSNTRWDAFDLATDIRKLCKSKIVMGGVHATLMPEQCIKYCDVVIKGDGESPFLDLCQGREPVEKVLPIDSLRTAYNKIDLFKYPGKGFTTHDFRKAGGIDIKNSPRTSIYSSRSCNSHCRFCSSFYVQGKYRMRDPKKVVDEMESLKPINHFYFIDDSFYLDKEKGLEFCREIIDRNLKVAFHIQTRADILDLEYVTELKRAGCYYISIGVETGSEKVMEGLHKSTGVNSAEMAIRNCNKVNLRTEALLIVGNEDESDESIEETRGFLKKVKPTTASSANRGLMILPGTAVYQRALKEGQITEDFWETRTPVKTYKFSQEQIDKWRKRVHTYSFLNNLRWMYN
jgi:anaerobic magnesium-protoporphyrin IX monomethyl ester cyclase